MSINIRQIPVFTFPNCLRFYLGTKNSHTQVLTLYSPYDFPIKYKVHCHTSAWDKYMVPNPEGIIPPQSAIDLVVTHKQITPSNCNVIDKIKIIIQDTVTDQVIGRKMIESMLLPGEKDMKNQNDDDFEFHSSHDSSSRSGHGVKTLRNVRQINGSSSGNNIISGIVIAVCAIILFLPTEPEVNKVSVIPNYLHVTQKIQLLAALLLGFFLCIIVRS